MVNRPHPILVPGPPSSPIQRWHPQHKGAGLVIGEAMGRALQVGVARLHNGWIQMTKADLSVLSITYALTKTQTKSLMLLTHTGSSGNIRVGFIGTVDNDIYSFTPHLLVLPSEVADKDLLPWMDHVSPFCLTIGAAKDTGLPLPWWCAPHSFSLKSHPELAILSTMTAGALIEHNLAQHGQITLGFRSAKMMNGIADWHPNMVDCTLFPDTFGTKTNMRTVLKPLTGYMGSHAFPLEPIDFLVFPGTGTWFHYSSPTPGVPSSGHERVKAIQAWHSCQNLDTP